MAFDLQEQEQIDSMKAWWRQYGGLITTATTSVLLAYAAYQGWNAYQLKQNAAAAELFSQVEQAVVEKNENKTLSVVSALESEYPASVFSARAALLAAKVSVENGKSPNAKKQLDWLLQNAKDAALQDAARLRMATLLADEKKFDEALAVLSKAETESYAALVLELKADIHSAKGDAAAARSAYKEAIAKASGDQALGKFLAIKLDALGAK